MNGKGDAVATGSYNNLFRLFNKNSGEDCTLEASRDPTRKRLHVPASSKVGEEGGGRGGDGEGVMTSGIHEGYG